MVQNFKAWRKDKKTLFCAKRPQAVYSMEVCLKIEPKICLGKQPAYWKTNVQFPITVYLLWKKKQKTFRLETSMVQNHKHCIIWQDLIAPDMLKLKHGDLQFLTLILARNARLMPGTLCVCVIFILWLMNFTHNHKLQILGPRKEKTRYKFVPHLSLISSVGLGSVLCAYIWISMYKSIVIYLPSPGSEYLKQGYW